MTACRYFDGTSSRVRLATATREAVGDGAGLRVVGDDLDLLVDRASLSFVPATDRGPARIAIAPRGLCEFDDRVAAEALFAQFGFRRGATDRFVTRTWQVVSATVAFVVVMAALYVWGVPWISDRIVDRAPRGWDIPFGDKVLETLDRQRILRPSELPRPVQDRIVKRFESLVLPRRPDGLALHLVFRKLGAPNALALPGGTIVLTDEIVELADGDDDAIATVLGHEAGHEVHRDALRQLARSTITSALAAWYFGDVSNAAVVAAGGIGTLSYTRKAEHEADLYAVEAMHASGISTRGAADLFRRLEAWRPPKHKATKRADDDAAVDDEHGHEHDDGHDGKDEQDPDKNDAKRKPTMRERFRLPEYLSTHPDTDDRIRLFEADGATVKEEAH